jgi:hypothetical protein
MFAALPAHAQFDALPEPQPIDDIAAIGTTTARTASDYRIDGARHLYLRYAPLIVDGKLPPMLHAIAVIRTTIDSRGRVTALQVTRPPAAAREVTPWIQRLIRAAEPFPPPPRGLKSVVYQEVWLVTADGRFQLHTLSEGQADSADAPALQ